MLRIFGSLSLPPLFLSPYFLGCVLPLPPSSLIGLTHHEIRDTAPVVHDGDGDGEGDGDGDGDAGFVVLPKNNAVV